ncbi:MAG: hypothetical protein ACI83D_000352 [Planctomycetota bacterium]|jgi:hypothetical protein
MEHGMDKRIEQLKDQLGEKDENKGTTHDYNTVAEMKLSIANDTELRRTSNNTGVKMLLKEKRDNLN